MTKKRIRKLCGFYLALFLLNGLIGNAQTKSALSRTDKAASRTCLPTGVCLDAAGRSFDVGNMPLSMTLAPEGDRFVVSLSGWREQGLQIVERESGKILQTLPQPSRKR